MHKYLEKMGEVNFDKIFNQKLGECTHIFLSIQGELSNLKKICINNSSILNDIRNNEGEPKSFACKSLHKCKGVTFNYVCILIFYCFQHFVISFETCEKKYVLNTKLNQFLDFFKICFFIN